MERSINSLGSDDLTRVESIIRRALGRIAGMEGLLEEYWN